MISILYLALVRVLPVNTKIREFTPSGLLRRNKQLTISMQLYGVLQAVVQGYTMVLDDSNQATAAGAFNFVKNL